MPLCEGRSTLITQPSPAQGKSSSFLPISHCSANCCSMDPFQQKSSKEAHHPAPGLCYAHCHWIAFSGADVCCLIAPGSLSEQNWIHGVQASKETGGGGGGWWWAVVPRDLLLILYHFWEAEKLQVSSPFCSNGMCCKSSQVNGCATETLLPKENPPSVNTGSS